MLLYYRIAFRGRHLYLQGVQQDVQTPAQPVPTPDVRVRQGGAVLVPVLSLPCQAESPPYHTPGPEASLLTDGRRTAHPY